MIVKWLNVVMEKLIGHMHHWSLLCHFIQSDKLPDHAITPVVNLYILILQYYVYQLMTCCSMPNKPIVGLNDMNKIL